MHMKIIHMNWKTVMQKWYRCKKDCRIFMSAFGQPPVFDLPGTGGEVALADSSGVSDVARSRPSRWSLRRLPVPVPGLFSLVNRSRPSARSRRFPFLLPSITYPVLIRYTFFTRYRYTFLLPLPGSLVLYLSVTLYPEFNSL